jgi:carbamoyltransferase
MHVLGVWDGHDSGAALIDSGNIVYAANEERFTKRKLEIQFPYHSIMAALKYAKLKPTDIEHVAFTTTEFAKTLERIFPKMKEDYYLFRRRKMLRPSFENFRHKLKYAMTGVGRLPLCDTISKEITSRNLATLGFRNFKLHLVEHHTAHAATAAFTAQQGSSLVITLDGLGDGLSGSVSTLEKGVLKRSIAIPARDSIGIFYEQVTNILGMRELEDEGKVMAMADYSFPFAFEQNRLAGLFKVEGTIIKAKYGAAKQYDMLQRISWQMPREQFSYMAQQLLENLVVKFVSNNVDRFNIGNIALAGGLFSNVKANMMLRNMDNVKQWHIFPHMGDGGIALGAALYTNYLLEGRTNYRFGAYLGDSYTEEQTKNEMRDYKEFTHVEETEDEQAAHAAELLNAGNYLLWFQGRMEYGPRALGDRSIIAPPDSEEVKEKLNLYVKRREWFQPFAPSMLEEEAHKILEYDTKGKSQYMTMAYAVRNEYAKELKSVVHIDGSARPQFVGEENRPYMKMLRAMKRMSGNGIVLNTSFNLHGFPIVMTPRDAFEMMRETRTKYMFINGLFVTNRRGV